MDTLTLLPWHSGQWQMLFDAKYKNRLSHALLFVGGCNLEKKHFARYFSAALLCTQLNSQGYPCDVCHACHMLKAESHPDLLWVEPEEAGQIIKVDQVRKVVAEVHETSMQSGFKIVIIYPAHAMNMAAFNALLKTLEEPAPNTLLILISDQRLRLPATITSRCQKIMFHRPLTRDAMTWLQTQHLEQSDLLLKLANGFPLKVRAMQDANFLLLRQTLYQGLHDLKTGKVDPLLFASMCQEYDMLTLLELLQSWMRDLLCYLLTKSEASLLNSDYQADFATISTVISVKNSVKYLDLIQKTYHRLVNRFNLNKQLLLEELWITWTRYVSC